MQGRREITEQSYPSISLLLMTSWHRNAHKEGSGGVGRPVPDRWAIARATSRMLQARAACNCIQPSPSSTKHHCIILCSTSRSPQGRNSAVASFTIRFNRRDVFTVICHWTSELIATRWARLAWRHSTTSLGRDAANRPAYHCCCCCCSNSRRVSSDGREWWRSAVTRLRRADVNTDASLGADEKLTCDPSYKISYDLS